MQLKSVKYNALMNVLLSISNILFPLISFPYVTHVLSVESIGKVNFYNSLGGYAILIAGVGIGTYGVKACAVLREDKVELSRCVHELFLIKLITSSLVVAVLLGACFFSSKLVEEPALLVMQFVLITFNIVNLDWFYSGIEQYSYVTKRSIILRVLSLILLITLVKTKSDFIMYGFLIIFTSIVSMVINLAHSRKFIYFRKQKGRYDLKKHIRPALTLFSAVLAVSVYTSLDTIMLGFISGNEDVGLYTVAVKVKTLLLTLINSI